MKYGVIRQFLKDGPGTARLPGDRRPPGTGDEPLSVAQLVGQPAGRGARDDSPGPLGADFDVPFLLPEVELLWLASSKYERFGVPTLPRHDQLFRPAGRGPPADDALPGRPSSPDRPAANQAFAYFTVA